MLGRLTPRLGALSLKAGSGIGMPSLAATTSTSIIIPSREVHHHKERGNLWRYIGLKRSNPAKANRNTHVNERKFRGPRGRKTVRIEVAEYEEEEYRKSLSPAEYRLYMLKKGVNPYKDVAPRSWQESQITFSSVPSTIDPYVPAEESRPNTGGGLLSGVALKGTEAKDWSRHKFYNYWHGARRMNKKKDLNWNKDKFANQATDIYIQAHTALQQRDQKELLNYITEHAYGNMWPDVEKGSIVWEYLGEIEKPKVVSVRCVDYPMDTGNDIAQVIVRMHTKQKMAVYDRFGSLILGSETEPKDVLEYVVFENHIAMKDGSWRLHDRVYPHWCKPKQATVLTYALDDIEKDRPQAMQAYVPQISDAMKSREDKRIKKEQEEGVKPK